MMHAMRAAILIAAVFLPATVTGQCLATVSDIERRELIADTSVVRTYNLCPNAVYNIGFYNPVSPQDFGGGDVFFKARPNVRFLCGPDGSSSNECIINGGTLHIDATDMMGLTEPATNVKFSGFTFADTGRYSFWGNLPGSITFEDCIFTNNTKSIAPVYLDYYDPNSTSELSVSFVGCQFLNHRHYGEPATGSIITANGIQNRLNIDNTYFTGNDMLFNNTMSSRASFLVETSGPISANLNCFTNNLVGVAPIGSYVAEVNVNRNYGLNTSGLVCQFLAAFETSQQFEFYRPNCLTFDVTDECKAYETRPPTISPSASPSATPLTPYPSGSPSFGPTIYMTTFSPRPTITPSPTQTPTASPSPSASPSGAPSVFTNATTSGSSSRLVLMSTFAAAVLCMWMV